MRGLPALCVVILALVSACGDTSSSSAGNNSNMAISEDSSYNAHVLVGSVYTTDIDIKNTGTADIPKLDIMFDGGDKFLDHNVIVKSDPCTVDKSLPGLACGALAVGGELKFTITYQPKDAGNFNFEAAAADQEGSDLLYPEQDGVLTWSEVVTA